MARRRFNPTDDELRALERRLVEGDESIRSRVERTRERLGLPAYYHDCDSCVFLGHFEGCDLYVCPWSEYGSESVLARGSSRGDNYSSSPAYIVARRLMVDKPDTESSSGHFLNEAWRRALARGLFQTPQSRGEDLRTCHFCSSLYVPRSGHMCQAMSETGQFDPRGFRTPQQQEEDDAELLRALQTGDEENLPNPRRLRFNAYDYREPKCPACARNWRKALRESGRASDGKVFYDPCPLHAPTERRVPPAVERARAAEEHWKRVERQERPGVPEDEIPPIENPITYQEGLRTGLRARHELEAAKQAKQPYRAWLAGKAYGRASAVEDLTAGLHPVIGPVQRQAVEIMSRSQRRPTDEADIQEFEQKMRRSHPRRGRP